jgi:hypothetical protein
MKEPFTNYAGKEYTLKIDIEAVDIQEKASI